MSKKNLEFRDVKPFGDVELASNFFWGWDAINDEENNYRYINFRGGSSSSKTYSWLQILLLYATMNDGKKISVIQSTIPALKRGSWSDVHQILKHSPFIKEQIEKENETDKYILFKNGSIIKFLAYATANDALGVKSHISYFTEINNISEKIFDTVKVRTSEKILSCYNPSAPFFYSEKYLNLENSISFISNYKDNPHVSKEVIKELLSYKDKDPNFYRVYALGFEGKVESAIYNFEIDEFPTDFKWQAIGIDFGYSIDPSAVVLIRFYDGKIYVKQLINKVKLSNEDLSNLIKKNISDLDLPNDIECFCDSAEPRSIAQLKSFGLNCIPVKKGNDSLRYSIQLVKGVCPLLVSQDSTDLIKELRAYRYDENQRLIGVHNLLDASRYVIMEKFSPTVKTKNKMRWLRPQRRK
jgi:phage terminase large subunit